MPSPGAVTGWMTAGMAVTRKGATRWSATSTHTLGAPATTSASLCGAPAMGSTTVLKGLMNLRLSVSSLVSICPKDVNSNRLSVGMVLNRLIK